MTTLKGIAVSPGIARGKAFLYRPEIFSGQKESQPGGASTEDQHERIKSAISDVKEGLETDARDISQVLDPGAGEIFRAQSAMMEDNSVIRELERYLGRGPIDAEEAVRTVFSIFAGRFRNSKDEGLRARGDDVDDLSRRLLLALSGAHAHRLEAMPGGSVLVARHLFPSDTVFLSRASTVAVLAEFAGPAAHAAMLTRELGIPCVGGIAQLMDHFEAGADVIVDGNRGLVVIDPDIEAAREYDAAIAEGERARHPSGTGDQEAATTANGVRISIMANAWNQEDVRLAIQNGAEGIGLFRTEPFFMASKHLPSAEDFTTFLRRCLEPAGGRRVNVRLLDVGADKNPPYLPLPAEPDPFMGMRGARVLLRYPDLLDAQLRALLQSAKEFNLGILIPMVTLESDVTRIIAALHRIALEMGVKKLPPVGAMIETPAAALAVPSLINHVDFLSIGSNDLTQYTLAAGRENASVSEYFIDDHPSIFRLIEIITHDSGGIPVSLCGELAGRTHVVPQLLRSGLRSLSVASSVVPSVRQAVSQAMV